MQKYEIILVSPNFWDKLLKNVMNGNSAIYDPILA